MFSLFLYPLFITTACAELCVDVVDVVVFVFVVVVKFLGIWLQTLPPLLSLKQKFPFSQSKSIPFGHGLIQSNFSKEEPQKLLKLHIPTLLNKFTLKQKNPF